MDELDRLCERSARGDITPPPQLNGSAQVIANALIHAADPGAVPHPVEEELEEAARVHGVAGANAIARLWMSGVVSASPVTARLDGPYESHELQCARVVSKALASEDLTAHADAMEALREIEKAAARDGDAYGTVMAAAWCAQIAGMHHGSAESGSIPAEDGALAIARRATRMARTESFPQLQYLSGLALARQRRIHGTPHLAARILSALSAIAGPRWRGWITWELLWVDDAAMETRDAPSAAVDSLLRAFDAARAGDHAALRSALDSLGNDPSMPPFSRLEPEAYRSCVLGEPPHPFTVGRARHAPLGMSARASAGDALCVALVAPGAAPKRVFASAMPLHDKAFPLLPRGTGHIRKESTICALAFAPAMSMEVGEAFQAIYGFAYLPETHASTFRSMLHHVRALLDDAADIVREGSHLTLRVHRPFAIRDPLCENTLHDRVLRVLAKRSLGAKRLAAVLELPLRSAQLLLGELVATGGCVRQRSGNKVQYIVEDTTFAEPTLIGRRDA